MLAGHGIVALLLAVAAPVTDADLERRAHAREASQAGDHVGTAEVFESQWWRTKDPADLFDAASARLTARHYAHAVAHLHDLLGQPALPPERRAEAEALLQQARRELVAVTLDVRQVDARDDVQALTAVYRNGYRPPLRLSIAGTGRRYTRVIELDPGDWELFPPNATGPLTLNVPPGQPLRVAMEVPPEDDVSRRRKFSFGVAASSAPGLVAGATLLALFRPRVRASRRQGVDDCDANSGFDPLIGCPSDVKRHLLLTGTGGGLLGWSTGMLTGGLLGLLPDYRRRRTAWFSTVALGGAALVGGVVVTSLGAHRFNEFRGDPMTRDAAAHGANLYLAGTPILGLGAGLLMSSIAGLAAEYCHGFSRGKLERCAALRGSIRPDAATLTISGSF